MSDTTEDPFTQGAKAVFDALMAFPQFADEVRLGNRVSAVRRPGAVTLGIKPKSIAPADTLAAGSISTGAALEVSQSGYLLRPFGSNSRIAEASETYTVALATASPQEMDATRINRLKWFGLRALFRAGDNLGLTYVRGWTISEASETAAQAADGQWPGWSTAFAVNVDMYWPKNAL